VAITSNSLITINQINLISQWVAKFLTLTYLIRRVAVSGTLNTYSTGQFTVLKT